ncbi:Lcl C-terminal domain-containing protein [Dysgonomonas sp.]
MKKCLKFLFIAGLVFLVVGCDDDDKHVAEPIPPIFKEVKMPGEMNIIPGQATQITGLGFSREDKMFLTGAEGTKEVEVLEATDSYIKFIVPIDAGGEYSVTIERAERQTTLNSKLKVPFVVPLTDVELPKAAISQEGEVYIVGKGFENGDMAKLTATFYPDGTEYGVPVTLTSEGAKFNLPKGTYGVNTIVIERGNRKSNLGAIIVATNVGDVIGGGIVFWVDTNKAHGYIASKTNVGTATEQFGPEVDPSNAAGTSQTMGSGKSNSQKIAAKMAQLRSINDWPEWRTVKIAAELCEEFSITENNLTYTDWFLPSREELIELFKAKNVLASKGYPIPANNYWSSSEADGNSGWAAYYVNFYEDTKIVSEFVSKSGWKIGVRPVRSY